MNEFIGCVVKFVVGVLVVVFLLGALAMLGIINWESVWEFISGNRPPRGSY